MDANTLQASYVDPTLEVLTGETENLREVLDQQSPAKLRDALTTGSRNLKAALGMTLTSDFEAAIDAETRQLRAGIDRIEELWVALDEYDRYGTWQGALAGFFSPEAAAGAKIGTAIFPGIGSVIGGMVGGFVAGSRVGDEAERAAEAFDSEIMAYGASMDDSVQRLIARLSSSRVRIPRSWLSAAVVIALLTLLSTWLVPHIAWR
jgi:hypothetical protein